MFYLSFFLFFPLFFSKWSVKACLLCDNFTFLLSVLKWKHDFHCLHFYSPLFLKVKTSISLEKKIIIEKPQTGIYFCKSTVFSMLTIGGFGSSKSLIFAAFFFFGSSSVNDFYHFLVGCLRFVMVLKPECEISLSLLRNVPNIVLSFSFNLSKARFHFIK